MPPSVVDDDMLIDTGSVVICDAVPSRGGCGSAWADDDALTERRISEAGTALGLWYRDTMGYKQQCVQTRAWSCVGMCIDMHIDMCMDMRMDMCMDTWHGTRAWTCV